MKRLLWTSAATVVAVLCGVLVMNRSCPRGAVRLAPYESREEGVVLRLVEPEGTPNAAAQLETLAALGFAPSETEAAAFQDYIFSECNWLMETLEMYPY